MIEYSVSRKQNGGRIMSNETEEEVCEVCEGFGEIECQECDGNGIMDGEEEVECEYCGGGGVVSCDNC